MKKHTKKLISLVLTFVMVFAMTATVFAAPADTTITVGEGDNRTYDVYQIFTGDLSGDVLSNVKWGKNGTGTLGEAVPQTTLDAVVAANSITAEDDKAAAIAEYVDLESEKFGTVSAGEPLTAPTGYYLFKDVTVPAPGQAYSLYVVKIVGPTTFAPKTGEVESFKKVDDKNDSNTTEDTVAWQDSADYDMGDMVPFQLTGTLPEDYDNYDAYYYAFHDTECEGLTFDAASVKVFVDGNEITEGFEVVTEGIKESETFEVRFANLKDIAQVNKNSVITVEYFSELNSGAVIGAAGNPNEMYLEYSNNPNSEWAPSWGEDNEDNDNDGQTDEEDEKEGPTGETPVDKVIVFTYKVVVNKVHQTGVDEEGNPVYEALEGAGFTLFKKDAATGEYVAVGEELKGDAMTTFSWERIDDGDYRLEETTTPAGYNTIAPIEFTVSATHELESAAPQLLTLEGGNMFTGDVEALTLTADVVNQAGTTLPETGGVGTTMIYVAGAVLVLGAGVVLVTKKRAA